MQIFGEIFIWMNAIFRIYEFTEFLWKARFPIGAMGTHIQGHWLFAI